MYFFYFYLLWFLVGSLVVFFKYVVLKEDMWLVFVSMRILDGECSKFFVLVFKLGWLVWFSGRRLVV